MVAQGLFQPPLKTHIYLNTLHQAEAELAKLRPVRTADDEQQQEAGDGDSTAEDYAAEEASADGARWEEGDIKVITELQTRPMGSRVKQSVVCLCGSRVAVQIKQ